MDKSCGKTGRRRLPGLALRYHPSGRRVLGRPKQRWQEHLKDKKEKSLNAHKSKQFVMMMIIIIIIIMI